MTEQDDEAIEPSENALPPEKLRYPELDLADADGAGVDADGRLEASLSVDREALADWLHGLADALASHDLAFDGEDYRATYGVAPDSVAVSFDPDEEHRGTLSVSVDLAAKVMDVADADQPKVGARGGKGFIPLAMLTDGDDRTYHCYNWIEDPTADESGAESASDSASRDEE